MLSYSLTSSLGPGSKIERQELVFELVGFES
jgi:hypothetical protein